MSKTRGAADPTPRALAVQHAVIRAALEGIGRSNPTVTASELRAGTPVPVFESHRQVRSKLLPDFDLYRKAGSEVQAFWEWILQMAAGTRQAGREEWYVGLAVAMKTARLHGCSGWRRRGSPHRPLVGDPPPSTTISMPTRTSKNDGLPLTTSLSPARCPVVVSLPPGPAADRDSFRCLAAHARSRGGSLRRPTAHPRGGARRQGTGTPGTRILGPCSGEITLENRCGTASWDPS